MPRVALSNQQKYNATFARLYAVSMAQKKFEGERVTGKELAEKLHITPQAMYYQMREPWERIPSKNLYIIAHTLGWTARDLQKLFRLAAGSEAV